MTPTQFSEEISKIFSQAREYHSSEQKKEFEDPALIENFSKAVHQLSDGERYTKFLKLRLEIFDGINNDLGYFPAPLLMDALVASAAIMRSLSQFDNSNGVLDLIFHKIRQLGDGLSAASSFKSVNKYTPVETYTTHPTITSLTSRATAGDCFLFNSMYYATGQAPFKGIHVSPVVEHYFSSFTSANPENPSINLQLALERSAHDIFGNENPLFQRISQRPKNTTSGFKPIIFIIFIVLVLWVAFR